MRTWTIMAAGVIAASVGVTAAAVVPTAAGQSAQGDVKPPAASGRQDDDQPRREVRRHIEVLGGQDVRIGVGIRDLEGDQARTTTGAVVTSVGGDSPAEKAGIKEGDVIVEFAGEKVRSARQLSRLVAETVPGRPVQAVVQRDGRRVDLEVTPEAGMAWLGEPGMHRQFELGGAPGFKFDGPAIGDLLEKELGERDGDIDTLIVRPGRARLGIGIHALTPQLAEYFGTKDGVLVTTVEPDSAAAKAGLRAGDVITAVGDTAVSSPSDLSRAVHRADEGGDLSISYTRDKKSATTKATLEPRSREKVRKGGQPI
jgi:serine protease Do